MAKGDEQIALSAAFQGDNGTKAQKYRHTFRLQIAQGLLEQTGLLIAIVAQLLGFQAPFYFSR